ncbi:urease subunit beta [Chengkuizengella axinellae]|uniref:Urease subunit beta n=1 Tax=Chengkuizengella axinellae TaxID=3064388 RepID=A0ABT9IXA0_9BACL|nr:urease subunit beta [Chengkuizengella sp. 2205SS18-9]MDP5273948.1 urease subunit beta [Chengkuizengella sp. 2205SS18-9]
MIPGEYRYAKESITLNKNRKIIELLVINKGDRPIQVGSHFHFYEVNSALDFDRSLSYGMRLDIPAGMAIRFEPGEEKPVTIVELGGQKIVYGLNNLVNGKLESSPNPAELKQRIEKWKEAKTLE